MSVSTAVLVSSAVQGISPQTSRPVALLPVAVATLEVPSILQVAAASTFL